MSTVIAKNVQVGTSTTATDNFTIFQPATPDGTLRIGNGNTGVTTGLVTLNSSGNLGLGVTPSAWSGTNTRSLDISLWTSIANGNAFGSALTFNGFYNGTSWIYKQNNTAAKYEQDGSHRWYTAPSGTAGNAISFTQAMTLDASGNLALNGGYFLTGSTAQTAAIFANPTVSDNVPRFEANGTTAASNPNTAFVRANTIIFTASSAATERARIDSSGNLLIQTTNNGASTAGGIRMGDIAAINQDINSLYINAGAVGASTATRLKTGSSAVQIFMDSAQGSIKFGRAASGTAGTTFDFTESARIDSSGNLLVGTTSASSVAAGSVNIKSGIAFSGGTSGTYYYTIQSNTTDFYIGTQNLSRYAALVGLNTFSWWSFGSDRRIKTEIEGIKYGLDSVLAMQPRQYKFKDGGDFSIGFIAQELKEVVPEAVTGEEIEFDDADTPQERAKKTMGVSKDALIPVLVKAIQEQQALIQTLTARVAALESN